jgi:hypothetical protein
MCSTHFTSKDQGGLQYTDFPLYHEIEQNLSQD